ncbi:hypothetical protein [Methylobacterium nodulans]|uniref:Uncharacterized protein n=1 Tax=Methylobacterium nodulans (strain LMG 21967 / CNCM I-2342 / ORS 2060) TaxID=460265 RepID=B8ISD5_METNO|nr:hypothetical protein [Methylobacterium nodulans]ACL58775.1 hypothetical protein Mnod_3875 [Methylobacterium nodulans ORS 2060]
MNRRSLLAMLGLAPVAAPAALASAKEVVDPSWTGMLAPPGEPWDLYFDGDMFRAGSITADKIQPGSISISKISDPRAFETPLAPLCTGQDRLIGALSFGA